MPQGLEQVLHCLIEAEQGQNSPGTIYSIGFPQQGPALLALLAGVLIDTYMKICYSGIGPDRVDHILINSYPANRKILMNKKPYFRSLIVKLLPVLAVLVILYFFSIFFRFYSEKGKWLGGGGFLGVPRPPIPSYAMHIDYLGSGSLPGYRTIRFETDQPAEEILEFYQTELPKRGWYSTCSTTQLEQPGCPLGDFSHIADLRDGYKRDDEPSMFRAIDVVIYKPGEQGVLLVDRNNRIVEVTEYRYPLYSSEQAAIVDNNKNNVLLTPGVYPWPGSDTPTPYPAYP